MSHYISHTSRFSWVILMLFCALTFTNAAIWITFAPLESTLKLRYSTSSLAINWLSMVRV